MSQQQLIAIEKHLPLAQWALEALTDCTLAYSQALPANPTPADIEKAKKNAQCQPYRGREDGKREPAINVVTATAETQDYFLREVDKMSQFGTLEVSTAFFTGTRSEKDGLAWAIWLHEVGEQNRGSGATAKANGIPQGMTPIVTKRLAKDVNAAMAYWNQLFNTYGMLKVVAQGIKGGPQRAEERQIAVDREITCDATQCLPGTVGAVAKRFMLPTLHAGQVLFVRTDLPELWKISREPNMGAEWSQELTLATTLLMSKSVNKYATMSGLFAYDPQSFAPAGPLPNSPKYGVRVGYSAKAYEVCLKNGCIYNGYTPDPQSRGFQPIQTWGPEKTCWNPVNIEDKRPDWNGNFYNPNTYVPKPFKFWKTGEEIYRDEIWAPVSMPWALRDVQSRISVTVGQWGWGMAPACVDSDFSTNLRGSMRKMDSDSQRIHPYLGWK